MLTNLVRSLAFIQATFVLGMAIALLTCYWKSWLQKHVIWMVLSYCIITCIAVARIKSDSPASMGDGLYWAYAVAFLCGDIGLVSLSSKLIFVRKDATK